jgi:hypothetical protein
MSATTEWVQNNRSKAYRRSALNNAFWFYNLAAFRRRSIHCDIEYRLLVQELEATLYKAKINHSNTEEHVPESKRSIRVIKRRCRATFHVYCNTNFANQTCQQVNLHQVLLKAFLLFLITSKPLRTFCIPTVCF